MSRAEDAALEKWREDAVSCRVFAYPL